MKRHRAPQYDLAGQELIFNLAGELIRQESPKAQPDTKPDLTREMFPASVGRNCTCHDITWGGKGYQCLNCGATADHSWNIKHARQPQDTK